MTDSPSGATALLAGAISYTLGVCALVRPGEMTLPTPCADWNLGMLLAHLSDSMADLETAIRTGTLDLERPPDHAVGDPVETLRDRAAQLLCAAYGCGGAERFVAGGGRPRGPVRRPGRCPGPGRPGRPPRRLPRPPPRVARHWLLASNIGGATFLM